MGGGGSSSVRGGYTEEGRGVKHPSAAARLRCACFPAAADSRAHGVVAVALRRRHGRDVVCRDADAACVEEVCPVTRARTHLRGGKTAEPTCSAFRCAAPGKDCWW